MLARALSVVLLASLAAASHAAIIPFTLNGAAGTGLRTGNEVPAVTGNASGGALAGGISYNDVTRALTINIGWGTGNGFQNLTGAATVGHIHGPTLAAAPTSFTQNANPLIDLHPLAGWNSSATAGGFSGTVTIPTANVNDLLTGRLYINIHTAANAPGEIRGYLVPAPGAATLALLGVGALGLRRRR